MSLPADSTNAEEVEHRNDNIYEENETGTTQYVV